MNLTNFLLGDLVTKYSNLRPQIYFKSSLIALARAMEDIVLASDDSPLVIANFQQERFFRSQQRRFSRIAEKTAQVYILAVPEMESSFSLVNSGYETIPLQAGDNLAAEKCLIIIGQEYTACLVGQEKLSLKELKELKEISIPIEQKKRFEGFWTFDSNVTRSAAQWLLARIESYRPELKEKIKQDRDFYNLTNKLPHKSFLLATESIDIGIFTQRLVTYLQASQYKLLKTYRTIALAERKESLINKISQAQNQSLNLEEILRITVKELGKIFSQCRCLLYRVNPDETEVIIEYEFVPSMMPSLLGQKWSVSDNPVFIIAQTQNSALVINDVADNIYLRENPILKEKIERAGIESWLMIPIRYQKNILGILELHYSGIEKFQWQSQDIALVEAVSNSAGIALTQASAYTNMVQLNEQLAAVERIQNNLIAVVGHELRTPLSTIRICLESLASEPDMSNQLRETMLDTALSDSQRLGQLIQDFLTLSKLEAKKAYRNIESVTIDYALNLALNSIQRNKQMTDIPNINIQLPHELPLVLADVEGLIEVFTKLLDNACKFTPVDGSITVTAKVNEVQKASCFQSSSNILEVIIADTGRGIEESQLELIFDRFSQSENYLRRTVSGVGLGLVICRKIIQGMAGKIWAKSAGVNQGSEFHFNLPVEAMGEINEV